MQRILLAALLAVVAGSISHPAAAATLAGKLVFTGADSSAAPPDFTDTVVFFKPDVAPAVKPLTGDITLTMKDKGFVPHVLVVTQGTAVRFPNQDPIFHNAFSPSLPNDFDLGLYDNGPGKVQVFGHPGLVHVYCNVHRDMFAYILVLDTPYFAVAGADGSYEIRGVPSVSGELTIWNPRTQVWRQRLVVPATPLRVDAQLAVIFNGVPDHMNKDGKPYFHHRMPGG